MNVGTGSAMSVVDAYMQRNPAAKVAVVDKDEPGGICLTRGCIPSKILLYSAELVRTIQRASEFGLDVKLQRIRFADVMDRMRRLIYSEIDAIRRGLNEAPRIDYYPSAAEFTAPYTLSVAGTSVSGTKFLLGAGSEPVVPPIPGLADAGFLTSDSVIQLKELPESLAIIGGGYIAAEYGHFFSAMGAEVTIVGRNPQFLPGEEPGVSAAVRRALERHLRIRTNQELTRVAGSPKKRKRLTFTDRSSQATSTLEVHEILVAAGRRSTAAVLHPERGGIAVDDGGWIRTNEFLETNQPNVWALGDATGHYPFKHKANYDAKVVYENLVLGRKSRVDYHAVPHAVFTHPEVASVGLREAEAVQKVGAERVDVGFYEFANTAKGEAMNLTDEFVKVLFERGTDRILGAHIVGHYASTLIQEVVTLLYSGDPTSRPIVDGMHIHPALSEVVERAFLNRMTLEHYHHVARERLLPAASATLAS